MTYSCAIMDLETPATAQTVPGRGQPNEEVDMADRTCALEDCDKPARSGGGRYCAMHAARWTRHGNFEGLRPFKKIRKICEKCGGEYKPQRGAQGQRQRFCSPDCAGKIKRSVEDRFWEKVDRCGPDECWPWLGRIDPGGYGRIRVGNNDFGRTAHAVSLEIATGEKANGRHALHACDNPSCVNPAHIRWGTHADNMQDGVERGRISRGEARSNAKLTRSQVLDIRSQFAAGVTIATLAGAFDLKPNTVQSITSRRTWAWL